MKRTALLLLFTGCFGMVQPSIAQPDTPRSVLLSSLAALGGTSVQSTTLSGTAEFVAGGEDDTGSFSAACSTSGFSRLQMDLSSASRTEIREIKSGTPSGLWIDSSGTQHSIAGHNQLTPESWFCPHIALAEILQNNGLTVQFIGLESKDNASVAHFTVFAPALDTHALSALLPHLTKTDIYLDFKTLLPVSLGFVAHPDNDANLDMPVEIRFGNYTNRGGVLVPSRVEKYVNSTLMLTLQINSASMNATVVNQ